ncbi:MAG: caspase family protein [Pseudotabrizicola sp.]|uniref:caspase family protein n=1 Tax=Pseudotabrizicola sp. TaxID=2939647 RepID=UPI00271CE870|nr:caspase family protein [Pseudotabrizicola sp.]MDO8884775.1 caspase family protein [Pseudotabrizicola sp.]MDP2081906.1 caspase family protein [Pseudotabrizicola sp.]MDZ7575978.1 caspase family protein [Pseudotabrizicola sp.]
MIRFAAILFRLSVMAFLWTIAQNLSGMALAEGRHALLVGIDRYDRLDDLQKARNDARAMDQALRRAGFSTTLLEDADQISFLQAVADFSARIEPGDEAVVYFAGHGVEIDGKN